MTAGERNTLIELESAAARYGIKTVLSAVQQLLLGYAGESKEFADLVRPIYEEIERFRVPDGKSPTIA